MERPGFSGDGTPHGVRATFSTHFNASGANVDVIERCLAHVPANRVRAAYNRHAYQDERREMLQAWGDRVDELRKLVGSHERRLDKDHAPRQRASHEQRARKARKTKARQVSAHEQP